MCSISIFKSLTLSYSVHFLLCILANDSLQLCDVSSKPPTTLSPHIGLRNIFCTTELVDMLRHPKREGRKKIVKKNEMSEMIDGER